MRWRTRWDSTVEVQNKIRWSGTGDGGRAPGEKKDSQMEGVVKPPRVHTINLMIKRINMYDRSHRSRGTFTFLYDTPNDLPFLLRWHHFRFRVPTDWSSKHLFIRIVHCFLSCRLFENLFSNKEELLSIQFCIRKIDEEWWVGWVNNVRISISFGRRAYPIQLKGILGRGVSRRCGVSKHGILRVHRDGQDIWMFINGTGKRKGREWSYVGNARLLYRQGYDVLCLLKLPEIISIPCMEIQVKLGNEDKWWSDRLHISQNYWNRLSLRHSTKVISVPQSFAGWLGRFISKTLGTISLIFIELGIPQLTREISLKTLNKINDVEKNAKLWKWSFASFRYCVEISVLNERSIMLIPHGSASPECFYFFFTERITAGIFSWGFDFASCIGLSQRKLRSPLHVGHRDYSRARKTADRVILDFQWCRFCAATTAAVAAAACRRFAKWINSHRRRHWRLLKVADVGASEVNEGVRDPVQRRELSSTYSS